MAGFEPKLQKGALITYDPQTQEIQNIIRFQYNPDTMERTLTPQYVGEQQQYRVDAVRFGGAPSQVISLKVEIDATDQLNSSDPVAVQYGIYPQLSALELLAYPSVQEVQSVASEMQRGTIEIAPVLAPIVIFVWGAKRVLPVRIDSVSTVEQIYDANLNPIRATVSLALRALSYSDLKTDNPAYQVFLGYQKGLESMAKQVATTSRTDVLSGGRGTSLGNLA